MNITVTGCIIPAGIWASNWAVNENMVTRLFSSSAGTSALQVSSSLLLPLSSSLHPLLCYQRAPALFPCLSLLLLKLQIFPAFLIFSYSRPCYCICYAFFNSPRFSKGTNLTWWGRSYYSCSLTLCYCAIPFLLQNCFGIYLIECSWEWQNDPISNLPLSFHDSVCIFSLSIFHSSILEEPFRKSKHKIISVNWLCLRYFC